MGRFLIMMVALMAGAANATIPLTRINQDQTPITIDGHVDEPVWQTIDPISDFRVLEPDTMAEGKHRTELRYVYDDRGIYVSAIMFQPKGTLVKQLSGRDSFFSNRDTISITFDTSGDGRYGFWFAVALGDALSDGTVLPERKFSNDWDGPWRGRSQEREDGWSAELFIPWGVVSMPHSGDTRHIGGYVSRKVAYLDERWGWPALPPTQPRFMSALEPLEMQGVQPGQQYSVYPFMAVGYDGVDAEMRYRAGADVFWRPSTNFQLTATVNPDFGNVESDEVVVNLSATEVFFPEKRLFFLEGQEVFVASPRADTRGRGVGNSGAPYTMVNSRRIGGIPREPLNTEGYTIPDRELVQPVELKGAVKATGQIGNLRYGVLGAYEEDVKYDVLDNGRPLNLHGKGSDYGIARVLYENSSSGAYKALGFLSTAVLHEEGDALAQGLDWHYLSPSGKLKVDGQAMTSDKDGEQRGYGGFLDFELTYRRGLIQRIGLEYFDEHLDINDLGFLQRNDHYQVRSSLIWTTSNLGWARENQFDIRGFVRKSVTESLFNGGALFIADRLSLNDLSTLTTRLGFFPSYYDDLNSFGNGTYRIDDKVDLSVDWRTDSTRVWQFGMRGGYRNEDLGGDTYTANFGVTWRPSDRFSTRVDVTYMDREGWLLHQNNRLFATFDADQWMPSFSMEYFISARQQLRMSLQWVGIRASEAEFFDVPARPGKLLSRAKPTGAGSRSSYDFSVSQFTFQARYRWELAPLSDLFIVYTRQADRAAALGGDDFSDIFERSWRQPLTDFLVLKLRYRLGT